MNAPTKRELSSSERLSEIIGEVTLSDSPCGGPCSVTWGDEICITCGRTYIEVRDWNNMPVIRKKLINIKNASKGYKIKQIRLQEDRWEEIKKMENIDNLNIKDVIKRLVQVAACSSGINEQDQKCIEVLTRIIASDHKFNDLSIKSIMSENDYTEIKNKFE
tara:strand:+ start:8566 stop:9051 length:486 start_codon:yes stop_codon:yes gene_type:complete